MSIKDKMDPLYQKLIVPDFSNYEAFRALPDIDFLGWADPFFPDESLPKVIKKGILKSLDTNASHYCLPIGDIKTREAVAKRIEKTNKISVCPHKNIVITSGSDISFNYALRPFLTAGEKIEVLMPTPSYGLNFTSPNIMGGVAVPVPTYFENNYDLDINEFEKRLTSKTKVVALTNPNNPTGTVYSEKSLRALAEFIIKNDLILLIDQCFEDLVFEEREMFQIITVEGMFERTILISSFSKGMGVCGLRIAYIAAHEDIMGVLHATAINFIGATNTMVQAGIVEALKDPSFMADIHTEFEYRTLKAYEMMQSVPNIKICRPMAGFFLWIDVSKLGTADEVSAYLLKNQKVAVGTGDMFGPLGKGHIRVITGVKKDRNECMNALKKVAIGLCEIQNEKYKNEEVNYESK